MKPIYKAALFDLDGTLLHTMRYWRLSPMEFALAHDFRPTMDEMSRMYLTSSRQLALEMCRERGIDMTPEEIGAELEAFVYHHYLFDAKPIAFALDFLRQERNKGIKMCIATGSPSRYAKKALERLEMSDYFRFVAGGGDYPINKSDPEYFRMMADMLEVDIVDLCVFEDALYSIKAAKEAGCSVVAIEEPAQAPDRNDIMQSCDMYIRSYRELIEY